MTPPRPLPLLGVLLALGVGDPATASRTAVVIGNASYGVAPLPNAARDAELVADRLEAIGFEVERHYDVDHADLEELTASLSARLTDAEIGVVYFAGHAVQIDGKSYLLPVDLADRSTAELEAKRVALRDLVTEATSAAPRSLRLIIVDACRTDPFSRLGGRIAVGLDTSEPLRAAEGSRADTVIAYSASSGQLASDGPKGGNGPFASALDRVLSQPGVELSTVTQRVASLVSSATEHRQVPWISGSLTEQYWLNRGEARELLESLSREPASLDTVAWYFLSDAVDPLALRRYALQFPDSPHAPEARRRLAELQARPRPPAPEPKAAAEDPGALARANAPIPADLFRIPRAELSAVPGGLEQLITDCDWLASDHLDPGRLAPGLRPSQINLQRAAQECVYAMKAYPDTPRFAFQLGRVLQAAELHDWARHYYLLASNQGYSAALTNLGFLFNEGIGVTQDYETAHRYYMAAAALGNLRARTNVGDDFLRGNGVPEASASEAVQWFRLASESGWVPAQNALATRYLRGEGVAQSDETAALLYRLAALNGLREAMHNYARALLTGQGVAKDRPAAHAWLERAIAEGDSAAPFTLARDLVDGGEGARDPQRVLDLYRLAWARGNDRAQLDLAWLYEKGAIVPRDYAIAYAAARRAELEKLPKAAETAGRLRAKLAAEKVARIDAEVAEQRQLNGR